MADAAPADSDIPIPDSAIAEAIIESIRSQAEFLTGLSVAIAGGLLLAFLQIAFHNRTDGNTDLSLRRQASLLIAFVAEGLSVLCGYLVHGALIAGIPKIFWVAYMPDLSLGQHPSDALDTIRWLELSQFVLFFVGVGLLLWFIYVNRRAIR